MRTLRYENGGRNGDPIPTDSTSVESLNLDGLMKGISAVESGGGQDIFMMNPVTSATGEFGQLYKQIKDLPIMEGVSREEFAKDRDLQKEIFKMRHYGKIPGITGMEEDAYELTEEYKPQLGNKWNFTLDEVAALSNFIGRGGARNYFASLRDGTTFTPPPGNKSVEEYLDEYREGRDGSMGKNESEVGDTLRSKINPAFMTFFPDMANE